MDPREDPAALVAALALHRELNGFTRSTRRGATDFVSLDKALPVRKDSRQTTRTQPRKPSNTTNTSNAEAPHVSNSKRNRLDPDDGVAPEATKRQRASGQTAGFDELSEERPAPAPPLQERATSVPAASDGQGPRPVGVLDGHVSLVTTTDAPQKQAIEKQTTTTLAAAAAASCALAKEKAKQGHSTSKPGPRVIKCFFAGVRWGISFKPSDIPTRADLATALNDAFAGEIISCGRGEALSVVFLDDTGNVYEFPSLRSSLAKESALKWAAMVDKAVKIYVRRC